MAELFPADDRASDAAAGSHRRGRTADLRQWVRQRAGARRAAARRSSSRGDRAAWSRSQRQLVEESKHEAIRALSEGFAEKMARLQRQLTEKDVTVSNIARYFEEVVAGLTEKSHRDPKTKLLNFDWFMERLESFLAVEQRVRWCGVGVVDINSFKWYNDTLGHAVGDKIIERVARILSDQIRSEDFLALERGGRCARSARAVRRRRILLPDSRICPAAPKRSRSPIASSTRSKATTGAATIAGLRRRPVRVDVGVVCLHLGPVAERRGVARKLAAELIHRADQLMYDAKSSKAAHVYPTAVRVHDGALVELPDAVEKCAAKRKAAKKRVDLR